MFYQNRDFNIFSLDVSLNFQTISLSLSLSRPPNNLLYLLHAFKTDIFLTSMLSYLWPNTYYFLRNISNEILQLQRRIDELKSLEEREKELEELEQDLNGNKYLELFNNFYNAFESEKNTGIILYLLQT